MLNMKRGQRQIGFRLLVDHYEKLSSSMEYPAAVLDVGCGTGAITKLLTYFPKVAEVVGLDISSEMLNVARVVNPDERIQYVHGDLANIDTLPPAAANRFQLVTAVAMLHWLPRPEKGLNTIYHWLKPGGYLAGYTVSLQHTGRLEESIINFVASSSKWRKYSGEMDATQYDPPNPWCTSNDPVQMLKKYFENAGFEVETCEVQPERVYATKEELCVVKGAIPADEIDEFANECLEGEFGKDYDKLPNGYTRLHHVLVFLVRKPL